MHFHTTSCRGWVDHVCASHGAAYSGNTCDNARVCHYGRARAYYFIRIIRVPTSLDLQGVEQPLYFPIKSQFSRYCATFLVPHNPQPRLDSTRHRAASTSFFSLDYIEQFLCDLSRLWSRLTRHRAAFRRSPSISIHKASSNLYTQSVLK